MAEFNCQCGKVLENSKLGNTIYVFDEQEIMAALQQTQNTIALNDFLLSWRRWALRDNPNVVYWKCPDCGKVYEAAPVRDGEVYRVFERKERQDEVALNALGPWKRLFVLDAKFIADATESAGSALLYDLIYLTRWEYDYFLSPEGNMMLALEAATNMSAFYYELQD